MLNWKKISSFYYDKGEDEYSDCEHYEEEKDSAFLNENWKDFIIGHSIVDVIAEKYGECLTLVLDNDVRLTASSNEGCGGCGNGWFCYSYKDVLSLGLKGNIITNLKVNCDVNGDEGTYTIMIYTIDKRMDIAFSGGDNGYYGMGIYLEIQIPNETITKMM